MRPVCFKKLNLRKMLFVADKEDKIWGLLQRLHN